MPKTVSVIITVYNEAESIHDLLNSLTTQTRQPDEVVIVDAGSHDDTVNIIADYTNRLPLKIIVQAGANISEGRNRAAAEASGDILAITDAGVRLDADWLEQITAPFSSENPPEVVSGFFEADAQSIFEVALGATVLPFEADINPATFLPSSRSVALYRHTFEQVGGYPEWLDYCEDLIFDLRLRQTSRFTFAPKACVAFRPRGSLRAFFKQYYLYARGDGKADLWRKRHAVRYLTYLVGLPVMLMLIARGNLLGWVLLVAGAVVYTRRPAQRLIPLMQAYAQGNRVGVLDWVYALWLIPIIRVIGDVAKMIGYPVGWGWRWRHHPPDWRNLA